MKSKMTDRFEKLRQQSQTPINIFTAPLLYPTPYDLAHRMVDILDVKSGDKILEPSAGTGSLLMPLMYKMNELDVTAVEINYNLCTQLKLKFLDCNLINGDFLELQSSAVYDRIIMNPPFNDGSDIKHVLHAFKFLKSGGKLVAIVANGPRQIEKLKPLASYWEDLPQGTFKDAGTMVNTALMVIQL